MVWFSTKVMKDFPHVADLVSCQFRNEKKKISEGNQQHTEHSAFAVALFSNN